MAVQVPRDITCNRVRAVRRRMSFARFEQIPRRLGWKHEYYGGKAYIKPYHHMVAHVLDLSRRTRAPRENIRPLTADDEAALVVPFVTAFAQAPEYAAYSLRGFLDATVKYVEGFFGDARGERSPASVIAENNGRIVGAALVKNRPKGPLLDCLFVVPPWWHKRLATDMVDRAADALFLAGETRLTSYALLANEASLAWHRAYGFHELPDASTATLRWRHYLDVLDQRREDGSLSEAELALLVEQEEHWREESNRLHELAQADFRAAYADRE